MHREEFGTWGQALSEEAFWQAVAMVGVLNALGDLQRGPRIPDVSGIVEFQTAEGPRREWTAVWSMGEAIADCREGKIGWALDFSNAWSALRQSVSIRLYLAELFDNQGEVVERFAKWAGVAPCSVSSNPMQGTDWQWPMRFGFLADARSKELQNAVQLGWQTSKIQHLQRTTSVNDEHVFEWLVLPETLDSALAALEESPVPVRAHCLLLTQPWTGKLGREQLDALATLQTRTTAKGIVQLQDSGFDIQGLVYQLSHNLPIEVALQLATKTMPLIFADLSLIEMSRIQRYVERLGAGLMRLPYALELGDEAQELGFAKGPNNALAVGQRLREMVRQPKMFDHERDGATWATRIQQAKPYVPPGYVAGSLDRIDWPSKEVEEGRRLQLNVSSEKEAEPRQFRRGGRYNFAVWIGAGEKGMFSGTVFPEEALPQEDDGYLLTISLAANGFLEQPQLRTVLLPRQGDSERCVFSVTMASDADWFEGRLTIAYQNRILQTYLITGSVIGPGAADQEPIEMQLEMNVQQGWAGLAGQSRVGASLVLNRQRGEKGGTMLAGYSQMAFSLEGLQQAIELVEGKIGAAVWDSDDYKGLRAKGTTNLLVYLAKHGYELLEGMRAYSKKDRAGQATLKRLLEAHYIQVLAAKESAKLPIEFFYSYTSPDDDATVCPEAEAAIQRGWCDACAKGRPQYVCPSGFWALQRVIEWHPFEESNKRERDFHSQAFAIEDRAQALRQMLWTAPPRVVLASSEKVDVVEAGSYDAMLKSIEALAPTQEAGDWADWVEKIKLVSPGVLVLVPHTGKSTFDEAYLEVRGKTLPAGKINADHVIGPQSGAGPIVLLLGCNTDNIDLPFRSFPVKFARAGAAIVVSTVSYVLGRHATRLAAALMEEILSARGKPTTFGELMLALRRKWLLKNEPPISLSLKAYGDARWRL